MKEIIARSRRLSWLSLGAVIAVAIPLRAQVHVTVNAGQVLRAVDDRMFGVNTAMWDDQFAKSITLSSLQAAGVRTLRFPGGSNSDGYLWNLNKSFGTDSTGAVTGVNSWSWATSFDTFAPTAAALNAQVFITVNYGTGNHDPATGTEVAGKGAQLAADWVTYANVTKKYGFKNWEVGNENYGTWELDSHAVKNDPYTYANEVKNYMAAMKKVDPTIRIGAVVDVGEDTDANNTLHPATNPRTGKVHNGWTPVMLTTLKSLGVTPDFLIYHRYPQAPFQESDSGLLAGKAIGGNTWADDAANLRQMVTDYLGTAGAGIELVVTENNSVYSNPGKQSTSLVNGLFMADSLGQLFQTEFSSWIWWAFRNGSPVDSAGKQTGNFSPTLYGWRNYGDYGMLSTTDSDPTPNFYVMKLLSHWARAGDLVVKVTSDDPSLASYGVRRTDGTLALLVVNKSSSATTAVNFAISGYTPDGGNASVYSYGIPQDDAARTGVGSPDVAATTLAGTSANFQTSFAPYSATVVVLSPAPNTGPSAKLVNIATRAYCSTGNNVTIGGFVISGSADKRLLIRAVGPSLTSQGLGAAEVLADPTIEVHSGNTIVASNDNWGDNANAAQITSTAAQIGATALQSSDTKSAALLLTLSPGVYSFIVGGKGGTSGIVLLEVYDADVTGGASFVNIATRADCTTGNGVTIGGFVIGGNGLKQVLVRAVGPTLATQGLGTTEVLADPMIEVHDANNGNVVIATNDNWSTNTNAAAILSTAARIGATPLANTDTTSSALLLTLPAGVYSFVASGKGGTSGVVLVEVYDAD